MILVEIWVGIWVGVWVRFLVGFFCQLNCHPGIFRANASIIEGGEEAGLFPVMSRMNHSCMPNTNFVWREDLGEQQVYAVATISEFTNVVINGEMKDR